MNRQGRWAFGYSDHKGHLAELGELLHLYRRKCGVKNLLYGGVVVVTVSHSQGSRVIGRGVSLGEGKGWLGMLTVAFSNPLLRDSMLCAESRPSRVISFLVEFPEVCRLKVSFQAKPIAPLPSLSFRWD